MPENLTTDVVERNGAIVIYVGGEIDLDTVERLRDAIEPFLGPEQSVVLDLYGVTFMDSSCLNLVVQARRRLTPDGGSIVLRNPSGTARRVLAIGDMEELLGPEAARWAEGKITRAPTESCSHAGGTRE